MHELSLIEGVLDAVRESAGNNNITRISKIKLVIGKMSMALPDSLQFAFQALTEDGLFCGAVLEIEEKKAVCRCRLCNNEFALDNCYHFICPVCKSKEVELVSGRELYIDSYEGDGADGTD